MLVCVLEEVPAISLACCASLANSGAIKKYFVCAVGFSVMPINLPETFISTLLCTEDCRIYSIPRSIAEHFRKLRAFQLDFRFFSFDKLYLNVNLTFEPQVRLFLNQNTFPYLLTHHKTCRSRWSVNPA